jgi:hypothetical protein
LLKLISLKKYIDNKKLAGNQGRKATIPANLLQESDLANARVKNPS